jgi:hypothetical protein
MRVPARRYLRTVPNSAQDFVTGGALFLWPLVFKRTPTRGTAPKPDERKHADDGEEERAQVESGPKTFLMIGIGRENKYRQNQTCQRGDVKDLKPPEDSFPRSDFIPCTHAILCQLRPCFKLTVSGTRNWTTPCINSRSFSFIDSSSSGISKINSS